MSAREILYGAGYAIGVIGGLMICAAMLAIAITATIAIGIPLAIGRRAGL